MSEGNRIIIIHVLDRCISIYERLYFCSGVDTHVLQNYDIQKRLGKGAYGIVWKAVDKRTKDIVALKKIFDAFRNQTDAQVKKKTICVYVYWYTSLLSIENLSRNRFSQRIR